MNKMAEKCKEKISIGFGIVIFLISLGLRLINISAPIGNDYFEERATFTAITVQKFIVNGFSFLDFGLPIFGEPWDAMTMEYPVYQMLVYWIMKIVGGSNIDFWCRLTDIIVFYISTFFLYKLVNELSSKKLAVWTIGIYVLIPFDIYWSRSALIDYTSVLLALIYCFFLIRWMKVPKFKYLVIAMISGGIGYIAKATTMIVYVYLLAFLILFILFSKIKEEGNCGIKGIGRYIKTNISYMINLALICVIPVLPGILWIKYSDWKKESNIYAASMTSEGLKSWNYGSLEQRLSLDTWQVIGERIGQFFGNWIVFVGLLIGYLIFAKKKDSKLLLAGIISIAGTLLTITNLYYVHHYYLIAVTPIISMIFAILIVGIFFETKREISLWIRYGVLLVTLCGIGYCSIQNNQMYVRGLLYEDTDNWSIGLNIAQITNEDELLLIHGEGNNPRILYYSNRKGLLKNRDWEHFSEEDAENIDIAGKYTTLVSTYPPFVYDVTDYVDEMVEYVNDSMQGYYVIKVYKDTDMVDEANKIMLSYGELYHDLQGKMILYLSDGNVLETPILLPKALNKVYISTDFISGSVESFDVDLEEDVDFQISYAQ